MRKPSFQLSPIEEMTFLSLITVGSLQGTIYDSQPPIDNPLPQDELSDYQGKQRKPILHRRSFRDRYN